MAVPKLALPDYPWTSAYRALVSVLREDPDLKRVVKTWRSWTGDPEDLENLTDAHMPWIQLTPSASPIRRATEQDWEVDLRIRIQIATKGTNSDDLMNLAGAILQALRFDRPFGKSTVGEYLRDAGRSVVHRIGGVPVDPKIIDGNFTSDGVFSILLHVPA